MLRLANVAETIDIDALVDAIATEDQPAIADLFLGNGLPAPRLDWDPAPETLSMTKHRAMLRYWRSLRQGRDIPAYADIDPLDMRFALGSLALAESVDGGADYRYRVYGTDLVDRSGVDLTGRRVSDIPCFLAPFFVASYRAISIRRLPLYVNYGTPTTPDLRDWHRLSLPMGSPEGAAVRFLTCMVPGEPRSIAERFRH